MPNAKGSLFYGTLVPYRTSVRALGEFENPNFDFGDFIKDHGFLPVWIGADDGDEDSPIGIAIFEFRTDPWGETQRTDALPAKPSAMEIEKLRAFLARMGITEPEFGWHISATYG